MKIFGKHKYIAIIINNGFFVSFNLENIDTGGGGGILYSYIITRISEMGVMNEYRKR